MAYYTPFVVLLLLPVLSVFGQDSVGGSEYVFAVPVTFDYGSSYPPHVLITTSLWFPVHASLTIPGLGFEANTTITKYKHADITLPWNARITDPGKHSKTVIVRASDAVNVHGLENDYVHGDGFLALPTTHLGYEHYIVSFVPSSTSYPSFFTVSALEYETSVHFLTKAGQEYHLTLTPFETYRFDGAAYEDLTGTHVWSDKPSSVMTGVFTNVPGGASSNDGLLTNIPPVEKWGNRFVLAPFLTIPCGYVYRVQSANQTTSLTISIIGKVVLQAGEHYEGDVTGDTMITIKSDFNVLVVQYMKGYYACGNSRGDPSMVVVTPIKSYYSNVTFPVFDSTIGNPREYFVNVIINCSHIDSLLFDDTTPMADWDQLTTDDQSMCALRSNISADLHSIVITNNLAKFTVSVYFMCFSNTISYIYQAGIALSNPTSTPAPPATAKPAPIGDTNCTVCEALNLLCEGTNFTASFNTSVLPYMRASDVHLWDPDCVASEYGENQAIITTDYHMCDTAMEELDGHMVFKNALILGPDDPNSPILPTQVNIECRVERRHRADTSYWSSLNTRVSFGNFSFNLEIFKDATYGAPYRPEDYPVDVKVGDEVYLAGSVITVKELDLFLESCWATPTADPFHDTSYSLITNGCPSDPSLTQYDSDEPSVAQFSFRAIAFKNNNWLVFVHCQMLVCDVSTPDSRCKQGCIEPSIGNKLRLRRSIADLHTVTSGPLVVRG